MYERCDECDKVKGKCECEHAHYTQYTEEKDHPKNKVPDVKKVIKATLGNTYVESIVLDGKPVFLSNINGEVKIQERVAHDGIIYEPIGKNVSMYRDYNFTQQGIDELAEKPPTKQYILDAINKMVNFYMDSTDVNKTLVTIDILLTYCYEWVDTVHYLYFVGETESGKSTALHIMKNIGYRPLYSVNLPYANIYNFLGTQEEGCGTILEDEAQELWKEKQKIGLYKNSYTKGSLMPVIFTGPNSKTQLPYKSFCLKAFAGEKVLRDKGFMERMAVVKMVVGQPDGNIKMPKNIQKEQMNMLRNGILYWKVLTIHEGLPFVESELINRDQELWENNLRIAHDTDFVEKNQEMIDYFINQRHESIWDSIEAKEFKLVLSHLKGLSVDIEKYWSNLSTGETEIKGELDKRTFYPNEYTQKITQNSLAELFTNKFGGKKVTTRVMVDGVRVQRTFYEFDKKTLGKLSMKYNVPLSTNEQGSGKLGTNCHNLDTNTEGNTPNILKFTENQPSKADTPPYPPGET